MNPWRFKSSVVTASVGCCIAVITISLAVLFSRSTVAAGAGIRNVEGVEEQAPASLRIKPYDGFPSGQPIAVEPYCGLKSLYSAAVSVGRAIEFRELLRPAFVGKTGSTAAQLKDAAESVNLIATPISHLTCASLAVLPSPVILHTKGSYDAPTYDHWLLCLGTDNSDAIVIDGQAKAERRPLRDLRALWDGTGILISDIPIRLWPIQLFGVLRCGSFILAACVVVAGIKRFCPVGRKSRLFVCHFCGTSSIRPLMEALSLLLLAIIAGMGISRVLAPGYLDSHEAIDGIVEANRLNFLRRISMPELKSLNMRAEIVLIDARQPSDYETGHIDGAINIPPGSSLDQCVAKLRQDQGNKPIVVYCQSKGCPYAGRVARTLLRAGYVDVRLNTDGYVAWNDHRNGSE